MISALTVRRLEASTHALIARYVEHMIDRAERIGIATVLAQLRVQGKKPTRVREKKRLQLVAKPALKQLTAGPDIKVVVGKMRVELKEQKQYLRRLDERIIGLLTKSPGLGGTDLRTRLGLTSNQWHRIAGRGKQFSRIYRYAYVRRWKGGRGWVLREG